MQNIERLCESAGAREAACWTNDIAYASMSREMGVQLAFRPLLRGKLFEILQSLSSGARRDGWMVRHLHSSVSWNEFTLQVVSSDAFTFYEAKKLCASHSASLISVPDLTTNYAIVCKCPCA